MQTTIEYGDNEDWNEGFELNETEDITGPVVNLYGSDSSKLASAFSEMVLLLL